MNVSLSPQPLQHTTTATTCHPAIIIIIIIIIITIIIIQPSSSSSSPSSSSSHHHPAIIILLLIPIGALHCRGLHEVLHVHRLPVAARPRHLIQRQDQRTQILHGAILESPGRWKDRRRDRAAESDKRDKERVETRIEQKIQTKKDELIDSDDSLSMCTNLHIPNEHNLNLVAAYQLSTRA
jgi:uncharacterized integral membrane protein